MKYSKWCKRYYAQAYKKIREEQGKMKEEHEKTTAEHITAWREYGEFLTNGKRTKSMRATIPHGPCQCECGEYILPGSNFVIVEGTFFLAGHETMNAFVAAGIDKPAADYSRMTSRKQAEQKPLTDLPLFGKETAVKQLSMF